MAFLVLEGTWLPLLKPVPGAFVEQGPACETVDTGAAVPARAQADAHLCTAEVPQSAAGSPEQLHRDAAQGGLTPTGSHGRSIGSVMTRFSEY